MGSLKLFAHNGLELVSSQVARIIAHSYQCPGYKDFFFFFSSLWKLITCQKLRHLVIFKISKDFIWVTSCLIQSVLIYHSPAYKSYFQLWQISVVKQLKCSFKVPLLGTH
jgi:hypothetical protein